jgi:IS66 Orf2 like protein
MIALPPGVRIYLACGVTDMRKGMVGLAMLVQQGLAEDPFSGAIYAFRGRRAGLIKLIWHDGVGLYMLTKKTGTRPVRLALDHDDRTDCIDPGTTDRVARWLRVAGTSGAPQAGTGGLITPESLEPIRRH